MPKNGHESEDPLGWILYEQRGGTSGTNTDKHPGQGVILDNTTPASTDQQIGLPPIGGATEPEAKACQIDEAILPPENTVKPDSQ